MRVVENRFQRNLKSMKKRKTIKEQIEHSEQYIAFLEKALASNNFKKKVALEPHLFEYSPLGLEHKDV